MPNTNFLEQLMAQYGGVLQDPGQNLVLPETGFFGRHPNLTRGLENALLSAATFRGGDTTGENISAVAQNVLGLPQARQQFQMQKMLAPLGVYGPLAQLAKTQSDIQSNQADMQYKALLGTQAAAHARLFDRQPVTKQYDPSEMYDDSGVPWRQNLVSGQLEPILAPGQQLPAGYKPSFAKHSQRAAGGTDVERQIAIEEQSRGKPYTAQERAGRLQFFWNLKPALGAAGAAGGRGDLPEAQTRPEDKRAAYLKDRRNQLVPDFAAGLPENMLRSVIGPEAAAELQDIDEETKALAEGRWTPGYKPQRKSVVPPDRVSQYIDSLRRKR